MTEQPPNDHSCESIPVRNLQHIQSFGALIAVDKKSKIITHASENCEKTFNLALKDLLNKEISSFSDHKELSQIDHALANRKTEKAFPWEPESSDESKEIIIHEVENHFIIEWVFFSKAQEINLDVPGRVSFLLNSFINFNSLEEFLEFLTKEVRKSLKFDKVLIYQFLEDGSGLTLTEDKVEEMPAYLGLRFPDSDIPKQVKELFYNNPLRVIQNAHDAPVQIRSSSTPPTLDLSLCLLKGIAPVHQEYTQHMKISTSISFGIRQMGKLWGLVCCHHIQPHSFCYKDRIFLSLFAHTAQSAIAFYFEKQQTEVEEKSKELIEKLSTLSRETQKPLQELLLSVQNELFEHLNVSGMALFFEDQIYKGGDTPPDEMIQGLIDWTAETKKLEPIFVTDKLSEVWEGAKNHQANASGLLFIRLLDEGKDGVLFFRPEKVQTVNWAGEKKSDTDNQGKISPRMSFELWKEEVKGTSEPFTPFQIAFAKGFQGQSQRIALKSIYLKEKLSEIEIYQITQAANSINGGLFILSSEHKFIWYNNWFNSFFQIQQDLKGSDFFSFLEQKKIDPFLKKNHPLTPEKEWLQEIAFFENGNKKYLHFKISSRVVKTTKETLFIGIVIDITDMKRTQEELSRLNEQKDQIMRMASHDIRNPLNVIIASSSILKGSQGLNDEANEMIDTIEHQGQAIISMLNELLSMDVIQTGKVSIHKESVDLKPFFEENIKLIELLAKKKEISIEKELHFDVEKGVTDKNKIKQVLNNFTTNAIKFSKPKSKINLRVFAKNNELRVEVQDHGLGIPKEEQAKVFQQGEKLSVKPTGGETSHGFGLVICKLIVNALGGEIGFQSEQNQGSTFFFTVPIDGSVEEQQHNKRKTLEKILIVDDDTELLNFAKLALAQMKNASIETATSGEEALQKAPQFQPDLILLDVNMPKLDGPATLQKLQQIENLKDVFVIFVSGISDDKKIEELKKGNVLAIIQKPFDIKTLSSEVQRIWES